MQLKTVIVSIGKCLSLICCFVLQSEPNNMLNDTNKLLHH